MLPTIAALLLPLAGLAAASPVEKREFALNIFAAKNGQVSQAQHLHHRG